MKKPASSCKTSKTRKMTIELDTRGLKHTWMAMLLSGYDEPHTLEQIKTVENLWAAFWREMKKLPSYTIRVNGRCIIKNRVIQNKRLRARVAKWAAEQKA